MNRYRVPALLLFISVTALTVFGVVMLYSVTADSHGERYLMLQAKWIATGIVGGLVLFALDYRRLTEKSRWALLLVGLPLLYLATLHLLSRLGVPDDALGRLPFATGAINGAFRWLKVGPYSVQPSEFAKIAIILYLAHYYGERPRAVDSLWRGLFLPMLLVGPLLNLVLLGGSLSVSFITGSVVFGMLFVAGVRLRYLTLPILAGLVLLMVALHLSPARRDRLIAFREPEKYADTIGYQLWQSQKALGSGGWLGVGPNQSRMKQFYLPEAHTDFILSIAGEELGFVTLTCVVLTYLMLLAGCFLAALGAADRVGMFVALGVGLSLGINAFVNLGVVTGFLPTTGVTAPLVSYGGSSMVVTWLGLGLVMSVLKASREQGLEALENSAARDGTLLLGRS